MDAQDKAILKSLVTVAWADGDFEANEKEMLEALLAAFGATDAESEEIRTYASTPRTIDDVPITDLSAGDRRTLLNHAVVLTFIDGSQHEKEKALIHQLSERLRISENESQGIISAAEARAKRLLELM